MATETPDWFVEAAVELAPVLRGGMLERERRDCYVFRPASWRLLALVESAAAEYRKPSSVVVNNTSATLLTPANVERVTVRAAAEILGEKRHTLLARARRWKVPYSVDSDGRYLFNLDDLRLDRKAA